MKTINHNQYYSLNDDVMGGNSYGTIYNYNSNISIWKGSLQPVYGKLGFVSIVKPIKLKKHIQKLELDFSFPNKNIQCLRELIIQLNTAQFGRLKPGLKIRLFPFKKKYIVNLDEFRLFYRGNWVNDNEFIKLYGINNSKITSIQFIINDNISGYFQISVGNIKML